MVNNFISLSSSRHQTQQIFDNDCKGSGNDCKVGKAFVSNLLQSCHIFHFNKKVFVTLGLLPPHLNDNLVIS